ncbi:MAG: helix-turn-helix transcriptional regulator [Proteobacteria bacterium]|nr:helix-turn-helix transcriptional regulator [Pseudomonadota bacterium]
MMKDTTEKPTFIGGRMRLAREALGLSQQELASSVGGSKRGIQDNEARNRVPGGEVIFGLVLLGINANWLLTGKGPMLLKDLSPTPTPARINAAALGVMFEAAHMAHPNASISRKAALAAEFYALSVEDGTVTSDGIHPPAQDKAA